MALIAGTIFLLLRASFDFAVDASSGGPASLSKIDSAASTGKSAAPETLPANTNAGPELGPPNLAKAQSIDQAIPYEVTAYAAKLWHAIDSARDKNLELRQGSRVEAVDIKGEWLHVKTESGLTGFVHQSMVNELSR